MADNKFQVAQPTEKFLSEGEREVLKKQKLDESKSSNDHSSDGNADSQAKPASNGGHDTDLPSFMPQGSQARHEAAASAVTGWNNIVDAIPNHKNYSLERNTSVDISNKFGSLNQASTTNTQVELAAAPIDETYQSINSGPQDSNLNQSQFGNVNHQLSAESMQYYEALLGNHNLPPPVLPSDFPFESYQAAEGSSGNTELSNLGTEWSNWNQYNMHDPTTPLGGDFPYHTLLNPYENMMFSQDMEGFNMESSYNPTYNYTEGLPVQGPKLMGMSSQAPGPEPEVLAPAPPPPPKVVNNRCTPPPTNAPPQPSSSRPIKNTLYDPIFETMGLPVDPHLRMFLARRENGLED